MTQLAAMPAAGFIIVFSTPRTGFLRFLLGARSLFALNVFPGLLQNKRKMGVEENARSRVDLTPYY